MEREKTIDGSGDSLALGTTQAGSLVDAANTAPVPADWERYELQGVLGRGGMGIVYKARDRKLGRTVALKFILGNDAQLTVRLLNEARAQARIEHEHVCKVFEVGEERGVVFIAMQLVEGQPLSLMGRGLSLEQKVGVMIDIADAVHAAHRQGIIHRDLETKKPRRDLAKIGAWESRGNFTRIEKICRPEMGCGRAH